MNRTYDRYLIDYTAFATVFSPFIMVAFVFLVSFRVSPPQQLQLNSQRTSVQTKPQTVLDCNQRNAYIEIVNPLVIEAVTLVGEATTTRNYGGGHLKINQSFSALTRVPNDTIVASADINSITTELLSAAHGLLKAGDNESYTAISQRDYTHVDNRLPAFNELVNQYNSRVNTQCGITEQEQ